MYLELHFSQIMNRLLELVAETFTRYVALSWDHGGGEQFLECLERQRLYLELFG